MLIGVDATCWNNLRGYGRFTRSILGTLLVQDQINRYLFFADRQTIETLGTAFPSQAEVVPVDTKQAPAQAASAQGRRSILDLFQMTRQVSRHKLDVFFFPSVYTYFPLLNRSRQVLTIHDVIPEKFPKQVFPNPRLRRFWQMKMALAKRQAHLVLTVSEHSKQGIIQELKIKPARLRVIGEGVDPVFQPLTSLEGANVVLNRYGLQLEEPFLLYVGGISPHKNLERLLEAFAKLRWNGKLALVGDYQGDVFYSSYQPLSQKVTELGLAGRVIFTGFVPDNDLVYLYNLAQAVTLPSLDEGFGLPALEAAACGVPVISSQESSVREILGEAGTYFDAYQPENIKEALQMVLDNPALRQGCRESGLQRAQTFTWSRAAIQLRAVLEEAGRS